MRKNNRKERVGTVISDRMDKTISVQVEGTARHQFYGKVIKKYATYKAHDEKNEAKSGDRVRIRETRPLSKTKRWRLVEIIEKSSTREEMQ